MTPDPLPAQDVATPRNFHVGTGPESEALLSSPMAAGLLLQLKAECEHQHARADAAEAKLAQQVVDAATMRTLLEKWRQRSEDAHFNPEESIEDSEFRNGRRHELKRCRRELEALLLRDPVPPAGEWSARDVETILAALNFPPEPNAALRKAFGLRDPVRPNPDE